MTCHYLLLHFFECTEQPFLVSPLVQVSFGRDFEQQLSFCVEARATFCNLEPVLVQLIHVSNLLVCVCFVYRVYRINLYVCVRIHICIHIYTVYVCVYLFMYLFSKMVNQLAMETRKVMKGSHSRKTAAFVRVSLSLTPLMGEKELCLQLSSVFYPGVCCLQFHHYPVPQQHLQSSQSLSAVRPGCVVKPVSVSGWEDLLR